MKALILDLNGIFIQAPKLSDRFEKQYGIPVAEFLPKASDCLYFDDQEKNVKAAESIGISSYLFTTEEDLKGKVESKLK
jgi:FMN phosphatase YigB (HAD superfamily)